MVGVVLVKPGQVTQGSGGIEHSALPGLTGFIANLMPMTWQEELLVGFFFIYFPCVH
jgi:hypothetical protein